MIHFSELKLEENIEIFQKGIDVFHSEKEFEDWFNLLHIRHKSTTKDVSDELDRLIHGYCI